MRERLVFGLTYSEVWDNKNLTIEAKAIYGLLCTYAGSGGEAYPSVDTMCEKLCISNTRFYKHMNLLIEAGVVEKTQSKGENGNFTNNVYTLFPNCQNIQNPYTQNEGMENEGMENGGMENEGANNNSLNNNSLNNNNNKKSRECFKPPTLEAVQQYCKERNNNINPQSFIDFYESKGWMIGKNKMKDWKAAVRTWERRDDNRNTRQQSSNDTSNNSYAVYQKMYQKYRRTPSPDDPFQ